MLLLPSGAYTVAPRVACGQGSPGCNPQLTSAQRSAIFASCAACACGQAPASAAVNDAWVSSDSSTCSCVGASLGALSAPHRLAPPPFASSLPNSLSETLRLSTRSDDVEQPIESRDLRHGCSPVVRRSGSCRVVRGR